MGFQAQDLFSAFFPKARARTPGTFSKVKPCSICHTVQEVAPFAFSALLSVPVGTIWCHDRVSQGTVCHQSNPSALLTDIVCVCVCAYAVLQPHLRPVPTTDMQRCPPAVAAAAVAATAADGEGDHGDGSVEGSQAPQSLLSVQPQVSQLHQPLSQAVQQEATQQQPDSVNAHAAQQEPRCEDLQAVQQQPSQDVFAVRQQSSQVVCGSPQHRSAPHAGYSMLCNKALGLRHSLQDEIVEHACQAQRAVRLSRLALAFFKKLRIAGEHAALWYKRALLGVLHIEVRRAHAKTHMPAHTHTYTQT
eukprot:1143827-Pelagomonas_calceolata.AAC.5